MMELDKRGRPVKYDVVGSRPDSVGLFWDEPKKIKPPPKEKIKRTPPEPTWLDEDFLPNFEQAQYWNPNLWKNDELWQAAFNRERVVFDIELYPNYFLIMFKSLESGKICYFEKTDHVEFSIPSLQKISEQFCLIGFNSREYDIPILTLALAGKSLNELYQASQYLTSNEWRSYEVLRKFKVRQQFFDHIDLIEVAPLKGSLKEYGGRLHTRHMQDLPFAFNKPIVTHYEKKVQILRYYCENDLTNTEDLYLELEKGINDRINLGAEYGIDLRSKSDAQIAEAVIKSEYQKATGKKAHRPNIQPFTSYKFDVPSFITFETDLMRWVLSSLPHMDFILNEYGKLELPKPLKELKFQIGGTTYNMGLGGLHSIDKGLAVFADNEHYLKEADITSYYPFAIINSGYYPEHLGAEVVKKIFVTLVEKRLRAKRAGNKRLANDLKITINGFFGKLSDKRSVIYSPKSMMQVTLTGQLTLLMIVEKLELAGIPVVSANTDGVVIKCPRDKDSLCKFLINEWEEQTKFKMEYNDYNALLARDVNNYMAVTTEGKVKQKGAYGRGTTTLHKNPVNFVCVAALEAFLSKGAPIEKTIRECKNFTEFVEVRKVTGGAVHEGKYLGKAVRWYKVKGLKSEIVYAKSGNKVASSDSGKPVMLLPDELPDDIDHDWYINEAYIMLIETGYPVTISTEGMTESQLKRLKKLGIV